MSTLDTIGFRVFTNSVDESKDEKVQEKQH
jgi:hypothetical protein